MTHVYRVTVELTPEDNPSLGLPEKITSKRGICIKGDFANIDFDKMVEYEVKGAIRAIEVYLRRWQQDQEDAED